jgi:hypothetical protein
MPDPPPPGFESQFAVVVLEIESPRNIPNVAVSDFALLDGAGKATNAKRIIEVEEFRRPRVATEGSMAYYLNPGGTRPWNGTLPAGRIRLRVQVALVAEPTAAVSYKLTLGQYAIGGPCDAEWPT